jgi:hypothetical protein
MRPFAQTHDAALGLRATHVRRRVYAVQGCKLGRPVDGANATGTDFTVGRRVRLLRLMQRHWRRQGTEVVCFGKR